jgi:hypothetical protein
MVSEMQNAWNYAPGHLSPQVDASALAQKTEQIIAAQFD